MNSIGTPINISWCAYLPVTTGSTIQVDILSLNQTRKKSYIIQVPDHQVAGHEAGLGKLGPLIDDSGRFYKPLQGDNRGSEEVAFYESFSSNSHIPEHIRKFFPMYYGTKIMKASTGVDHPHMVLQDLTSARVNPSVMDIKIGSRTWAPDASEAYIAKCLKKDRESTSIPLGFRLSGLQVYIDDESRFYKPDRNYIRKTGPDDVRLLLRKFVSSNPSADMEMGTGSGPGPDCSLASSVYDGPNGILAQLLELKAWFEDQTFYHFYACSFLFVYEKRLGLKGALSNAEVKLIDFAHVTDGNGVIDHNFLGGLCSLTKFISDILTEIKDCTGTNGQVEL
ncbi:putative inositol-polyphosphate multikinase [Helianthus annuus]|uniref:Inositol polyphosphate multikinase n=1 Tax=Helianthus annuus TaxID=4232 RepID=A0A9K3IAF1_HELAN|nr:putative inositol-polyphosphate multikinase [Helianthus annuus]KAJ0527948.1 putative inositol-polyphosphate multikinase [Helianthus annuus]KAJ0544379.1 putative inositol-polyphosphate multikinase [Helianthus annuus]KAJ0709379.1 putative inositol-polyphosphate multikinase [Helianthus annuus]KAJ0803862.1 putative inositol-polyphosphate multikinase [Helianthus annuus]